MTNWYVGQRVRCKDVSLVNTPGNPWSTSQSDEMVLIKDAEYTIREVDFCPDYKIRILRLQGIRRRLWVDGSELGWRASRFEPVQTTSIESLRSLLNPTPEEIERIMDEDALV